ncbi:MAG: hypothetical protein HY909_03385 [Deltaproteobacteria bacterium]|nr:hypothetical protein [Deltaproteobacteria bacterium]
MSLIELWKKSPDQLTVKHLHQIIAFAGEGKLRDGSATSSEFRSFLLQVPSSMLGRFVDECLNASFPDSGFALQDVINEVGRRLGFVVTNGLYQGRQGQVGSDGLWVLPTQHAVVVEAKTTDAYRIDTARLAGYRKQLTSAGTIKEEASSVLLVVGRKDTGDLEAQIRGSRYAWEIRLISADALLRLMKLKETLDDLATIGRICEILIPREYTRLDDIVDLVFSTAEEVQQEDTEEEAEKPEDEVGLVEQVRSARPAKPMAFHEACISLVSRAKAIPLVRQSRSTFAAPDGTVRAVCAVSKVHQSQGRESYWFAFHPQQDAYLEGAANGLLVLGCGGPEMVLAIPHRTVRTWLGDLWTTERDNGRRYWHIRLHAAGGKLMMDRSDGKSRVDLSPFLVKPAG